MMFFRVSLLLGLASSSSHRWCPPGVSLAGSPNLTLSPYPFTPSTSTPPPPIHWPLPIPYVQPRSLTLLSSGLVYAGYLWTAILGPVPWTLQNKVQKSIGSSLLDLLFFLNQSHHRHSPSYSGVCPRSHLWLLSLLHSILSLRQQLWWASLQTCPTLLAHALTSHLDCFLSGLSPSLAFLNSSLYTEKDCSETQIWSRDFPTKNLSVAPFLAHKALYYLACAFFLPHLPTFELYAPASQIHF